MLAMKLLLKSISLATSLPQQSQPKHLTLANNSIRLALGYNLTISSLKTCGFVECPAVDANIQLLIAFSCLPRVVNAPRLAITRCSVALRGCPPAPVGLHQVQSLS